MPAHKLGGAVHHDVCAVLKGSAQVGRSKGVVDHDRDIVRLGDGGDFRKGKNGNIGVAQRLTVEDLGIGPDRLGEVLGVGRVDKGDLNAEAWKGVVKLVIGGAVQPAAAHNMVTCPAQRQDRHRLGSVSAAGGHPSHPALQIGHPLFEHIGGGVHNAGVDITQLFQGEEIGRVFRIAELIAGGLVDRHGAAAGGRVRALSGVQLAGGKAKLAVISHNSSFLSSTVILVLG
ncbi:MAG TPA: hypothetical protein PKE45_18055 [Caldilineaceae bacterium]|nr:hypothetical protein [Caldilineaceae bacterium]